MDIPMVDLKNQYLRIKDEIDSALLSCVGSTRYIKGPEVADFEKAFSSYLDTNYTIGCGNGTDALQIALMALNLQPDDEIIVPAFTYVATAEAIALLGLKPVMVDVDPASFNISPEEIKKAITSKTKVIVPVHLYGQGADMEEIMSIAKDYNLIVIEDNAQAFGADIILSDSTKKKTGTLGHIGCYSFFPTKNLGCFGDGGAITTNDPELAEKCRMIAAHGQKKKYHHSLIGCNSRLDTLQAAILKVKLKYLDEYIDKRQQAAQYYSQKLIEHQVIELPRKESFAIHTYNQFTLKVKNGKRDELQAHLKEKGIPTIVYYPLPLYKQQAFKRYWENSSGLKNTEMLCASVLSIPMHTELDYQIQDIIISAIQSFE